MNWEGIMLSRLSLSFSLLELLKCSFVSDVGAAADVDVNRKPPSCSLSPSTKSSVETGTPAGNKAVTVTEPVKARSRWQKIPKNLINSFLQVWIVHPSSILIPPPSLSLTSLSPSPLWITTFLFLLLDHPFHSPS